MRTYIHAYLGLATLTAASAVEYFPLRPPSLPLAVKTPYLSAWTTTSNGGLLNTKGANFWQWPPRTLGWEGLVTVDGVSYEWLGPAGDELPDLPNFKKATPLAVAYDSQYSNFTFSAGDVKLTASFLSPVLPSDLCRTSVPLSYLTVSVESISGDSHNVSLYGDVSGNWLAEERAINWTLFEGSTPVIYSPANLFKGTTNSTSVFTWQYGLVHPFEMAEDKYEKPTWGNMSFSSRLGNAERMTYGTGYPVKLLYMYINQGQRLNDSVLVEGQVPVFAFAHNLGTIGSENIGQVIYTLGNIQQTVINYLSNSGVLYLKPWWKKCYGDSFSMITKHFDDLANVQALAARWENQLKIDIDKAYPASAPGVGVINSSSVPAQGLTGLEGYVYDPTKPFGFFDPNNSYNGVAVPGIREKNAYYAIVALSARQVMGAYTLAIPPDDQENSEPLIFQKEISSFVHGHVNTADAIYPTLPFFIYASPDFLRLSLEPLYRNQEGHFYPNVYAMHDLGDSYPNATGHINGSEMTQMPIESSGDMILMSLTYAKFSNNTSWLKAHYAILKQWSQYLVENCLFPPRLKNTNDFAGVWVNQTTLAIKGILAIKAMSEIAGLTGNLDDATYLAGIALNYTKQWEALAVSPDGKRLLLSYDWRSSWTSIWDTYVDTLLGLGVISQKVRDIQDAWYPTVSQIYGIPLDSRNKWTKTDWSLWIAATSSPSTRSLIITSLAYFMTQTATNAPLTDFYDTTTGDYPFFTCCEDGSYFFDARPVVGAHFSLLALAKQGVTFVDATED